MENKKYLPLKIIHLVFMLFGLCSYLYSIAKINAISSDMRYIVISLCQSISAIFALISGILYLVKGYKKNAATYFKGYVWIALIADMFATIVGITNIGSYFLKAVWAVGLILLAILATSKDLGKTKSYAIAICIFICKAILLGVTLSGYSILGPAFIPVVFDAVAQIILTVTTSFMVCGKYIDKDSRGAK